VTASVLMGGRLLGLLSKRLTLDVVMRLESQNRDGRERDLGSRNRHLSHLLPLEKLAGTALRKIKPCREPMRMLIEREDWPLRPFWCVL
jgi:hypothetical protein